MRRILVAVALLPAVAFADDDKAERDLGHGYRLELAEHGMFVTKGGARSILERGVYELGKVTVSATKVDVDALDITCVGQHHHTYTFAHLDARLANSAAFALHQRNSYARAAEGFAKAVAADPSWEIPAYNLASARTLLGDRDAAIAALSSRLASDPITTYVHVHTDPELRPLLARKELVAIHAKTPGTAKLLGATGDFLAYAPERGLVAVTHAEHSWGSSAFGVDLEIYDAKTSKLVATTELVRWDETSNDCYAKGCEILPGARAAIADRVSRANTLLAALGFSPIAAETAKSNDDQGKRKIYLDKAKLGAVGTDAGVIRLLRGNTIVATATNQGRLESISYIDSLKLAVVVSFSPTGEGCNGYPEYKLTMVSLTP